MGAKGGRRAGHEAEAPAAGGGKARELAPTGNDAKDADRRKQKHPERLRKARAR